MIAIAVSSSTQPSSCSYLPLDFDDLIEDGLGWRHKRMLLNRQILLAACPLPDTFIFCVYYSFPVVSHIVGLLSV